MSNKEQVTNWFHGIRGESITNGLRSFNNWRDDFLIELSTLLLMIGFIMGTVDILTRGGLVTATWFTLSWAIVQAIAIDGLFFAVWGKIARAKWEKGHRLRYTAMVFVGVILAIVAMLVNDILSYQQLANIADSLVAMHSLHIDSSLFVHTRAILVVAVALLVQLFCRSHSPTVATSVAPAQATVITECPATSVAIARKRQKKATVVDSPSLDSRAIPQHTTAMHSPTIATSVAPMEAMHSPTNGDTESMLSVAVALNGYGYREKIKAVWLRYIHEGRAINLKEIAIDAGVGYSTVKKWASSIREEIEQEIADSLVK